jgi:vancomycin resistance protein VanJ
MKKALRRVVFGYTTWMAVWFTLWLTVRDGWWWLGLLNQVVPQMFAPAPLMMALAVVSRSARLILASLVPPLSFAAIYWPYVVPQPARPADGAALKVMTFNVLFSNMDDDTVADVILKAQPDLLALQEVQPKMMAALRERLSAQYPYSLMGDEHPYGTTAAFSRYPVIDSHVLDLKADRPGVVLTVDVQGRVVAFISAHLLAYGLEFIPVPDFPATVGLRIFEQERQAQLLIEEAGRQAGPVIIACDCNSKETSGAYRILADEMANAARQVGWMLAEPSIPGAKRDTDLQHIDYVFYRGAWEAVDVVTLEKNAGSDHQPVIVIFNVIDE